MRYPALLLALLTACGGWTHQDTLLEAGALAVTAKDWQQTIWITEGCREQNPIMGKCGEQMAPNTYFPLVGLLHVGIALLLPPRARTVFQAVTMGVEINQTWANYRNGFHGPPSTPPVTQ